MPYNTKPLKRDLKGMIVPQYFDEALDDWQVLTGSDGAYKMQTPVDVTEDTFSGSTNLAQSFAEDRHGLVISNDGSADITFTVSGVTRTVKAGEVWEGKLKAFRDFSITSAGVPWRADAIQTIGSVPVIVQPPVDTTAPANVLNLRQTNLSATGVTLNWDASSSSDVASYNVYQGNTLLGNVTGLAFNVTGLSASTTYTLWVKAKDAAGNEASGTFLSVTTNSPSGDSTAPANVTSITPSNISATGVTLTWPAATENVAVTGYDIFNGSTFITTVTSGLTYTVAGLTASTAYTFVVKARDAAGNVSSGTSVPVTTSAAPDTTAPTVTASPAAGTYTSTQSVSLTGTDDSGGAVTIYYTTDGSTPTQSSTVYSSGSPISVPATASIKFFGKDAAGNVSTVQTAVYTINTVTIPATPTAPTATVGDNQVALTWTTVSGATSYKVYRGGTLLASPTTNSYTDATAVNGTAYSYTVSAVNSAGESAQSSATSATPVAPASWVTSGLVNKWDTLGSTQLSIANASAATYYTGGTTGAFTVTAIVKPKAYLNIMSNFIIGNADNAIRFFLDSTGQKVEVDTWGTDSGGAGSFPTLQTTAQLTSPTTYYGVTFSRTASGNFHIYINNTLCGSFGASTFNLHVSSLNVLIGDTTAYDMKHLLYYNRELTTAEMTQNYNYLIAN